MGNAPALPARPLSLAFSLRQLFMFNVRLVSPMRLFVLIGRRSDAKRVLKFERFFFFFQHPLNFISYKKSYEKSLKNASCFAI